MPKTEEKYTVEDRLEKRYTYPEFMKEFFPNINPADFEEKVQVTETTGSPQPASATTEGSGADEVNQLIGSKDLPLRWIQMYRDQVKEGWNEKGMSNNVLDLADLAEALQAELTALRNRLQESEDTVRGLRALCGRAAGAINLLTVHIDEDFPIVDDLRQAAKGEG